jgi:hypothetical protein
MRRNRERLQLFAARKLNDRLPAARRGPVERRSTAPRCAILAAMPLFVRRADEHYLDLERSPRPDYFVVLSGALEAGGFHRIASGPSEGRWSWGCGIGSGDASFTAAGYASHPDVCRTLIDLSFRRMLARADLREIPDARPGPPRRPPAETIDGPTSPVVAYDREQDRQRGPMLRNELRKLVRSGELTVGVLARDAYGPVRWHWFLSGLTRPDEEDFRWQGEAETEQEVFDELSICWWQWTAWAGLQPTAELDCGIRR